MHSALPLLVFRFGLLRASEEIRKGGFLFRSDCRAASKRKVTSTGRNEKVANSSEDFAAELLIPIAAFAAVIFVIQKILGWLWRSIVPYAIPILWISGILFALGVLCFILFKRAGMNRQAWKSLIFSLWCLGSLGVVVYCGNDDKLPWALNIVDSTSWVLEHPVVVGVCIVVMLILAVTIPIHGLGPERSNVKREFIRGLEDGYER